MSLSNVGMSGVVFLRSFLTLFTSIKYTFLEVWATSMRIYRLMLFCYFMRYCSPSIFLLINYRNWFNRFKYRFAVIISASSIFFSFLYKNIYPHIQFPSNIPSRGLVRFWLWFWHSEHFPRHQIYGSGALNRRAWIKSVCKIIRIMEGWDFKD